MKKKAGVSLALDPLAPNTAFILGAALSGGDPLKAARMLTGSQIFEGVDQTPAVCEFGFDATGVGGWCVTHKKWLCDGK